MPPRSIGTGTISFGLVSIPVRIYPATEPSGSISFNLLHAKCGSRLKQRYVCSKDGETVEREDMVKGFQIAKDRYVTFSAEELRALDEIAARTIDIAEFVREAAVDPIHFDRAYHLGPDAGGAKAYRLLALALERSGRAALARHAARGKQYLVLVRARAGRLVMQQLLYADEVRSAEEIPIEEPALKDSELQLALQLVEQTSSDAFHPEQYEDSVKKRVLEAIERKVQGQQIDVAEAPAQAQVIDLVEALKASLAAGGRAPADSAAAADAGARSAAPADGAPAVGGPADGGRRPPKRARPAEERAKASSRK